MLLDVADDGVAGGVDHGNIERHADACRREDVMQGVKPGFDAGGPFDRIFQMVGGAGRVGRPRIDVVQQRLNQRPGIERPIHDVGGTERLGLDGLDTGRLVGDENNLAVFRLAAEPCLEFEQVRGVSEIDVEQQTGLRLRGVNVVDIEKRQIENAAELPAERLSLHHCVAEDAELVHGWVQTYSCRLKEYCLCLNKIFSNSSFGGLRTS